MVVFLSYREVVFIVFTCYATVAVFCCSGCLVCVNGCICCVPLVVFDMLLWLCLLCYVQWL